MAASPPVFIIGVGPGLGAALVERFAREGCPVAMFARRKDKMEEIADGIEADVPMRPYPVDAMDIGALRTALLRASAQMGTPSALIHNASRWIPASGPDLDPEELESEIRLGAVAALAATQVVLPGMVALGRGTVIWTGSNMGLNPAAGGGSPALTAGKSALRGLALASAGSFHDLGVNFRTITIAGAIGEEPFAPSQIADAFWAAHRADRADWTAEQVYDGD